MKITVRNNGPFAVDLTTGDLELVDHEGNPIPLPEGKTTITLCRCGASTRKPFCDGTHSKIGFKGANEAREVFDAQQAAGTGAPTPGSGNGSKA
ncbi:MAG TPA: CDGSH iron-sulfur domain-containing protein [Gemmatimonadaceae bacterium]|jgi:3-phenylpropionate/trans-cinnamate dioxygenase ferredoxin subunit|nr:CDGSH iron-sulfur domain-containing protein [Gemmatimonadaceae bacterium]HEU5174601.1 CDGSH iron-sulfur domain-containing protein [Gemmatimonadaceae bacterium]